MSLFRLSNHKKLFFLIILASSYNTISVMMVLKGADQSLTLKALPSVSLHLPPVGLLRMFLQLLQATIVWA
jgi:hypothetical protein